MTKSSIGILLINTGTPSAPTPSALWHYLREFLSDRRVIHAPQWLWQPLLYTVILPSRSFYSANLYKKIWSQHGSPLRYAMEQIALALQVSYNNTIEVAVGMHYGQPSIANALTALREKHIEHILIFPLFPQYSQTTTASSFDKVNQALRNWTCIPEIRFIREYATHPAYIQAITQQIKTAWQKQGKSSYLLFSFHGLPRNYTDQGDPYFYHCKTTAQNLAQALQLTPDHWTLSFQSRTGYATWLKPYTQEILTQLPQQGVREVDIVCPGFSVDCLETLEEVAMRCKEQFIRAGGNIFRYIPALNNSAQHIQALKAITDQHLQGWI
ncbi:MAG: ferrochelatase [Gammaproteobacteria bacterium RIFCSPHIGHO2_12_FULL_41_20]|nr:MAG: ferrochelatase [Gammaproteobacteria bacterium RIFCSPHIGHO2_12_FULL_41_20]